MRRTGAVAAAVFMTALVAACGGGGGSTASDAPRPRGASADDAELLRGRRIYVDRCSTCHGSQGQGSVGPSFTDGKLLKKFPALDDQITFVTNGRGVMPAFGAMLDDDEIRAVVRYEREVLAGGGRE